MSKIEKRNLAFKVVSPNDPNHYFFGYYNLDPWSADGSRILAHRSKFADRFPGPDDEISLGLIDTSTNEFEAFAKSSAWNFQQGSKLQWNLNENGAEEIIHNDIRKGSPCTVIRDCEGEELRTLPTPFYALSPDGKHGITFNFRRINLCRPEYGYPALSKDEPVLADDKDGLWQINLKSGESQLLVSIEAIKEINEKEWGADSRHYLIHAVYNRKGSRILFLHRYLRSDGITQTRLFTIGSDGSDLRLLMSGMVSHFDWYDDETILAWAGARALLSDNAQNSFLKKGKSFLMKGLKPIYYALGKPRFLMVRIVGDNYHWIKDSIEPEIKAFAKGVFMTDGHCTFNRGGQAPNRWLLTDGYPNRKGKQPLYLWDFEQNKGFLVGEFFSPKEYDAELRTDLHPRFSKDANQVCIDCVVDGKRRIGILDASPLTSKPQQT